MNRHFNGLTRRDLVKVSTAATATLAGLAGTAALAQTPVASPTIDTASLQQLSESLVGGGGINTDALPILASLIESDSSLAATLPELSAVTDFTTDNVNALSDDARRLATDILQFWYLGQWESKPIEQRADLFFSLVSWQTVPYATQPTLCKGFGYWAQDVNN
jgi:hypothetical protein